MSSNTALSRTERVMAWAVEKPPQPSSLGANETLPRDGLRPKSPQQDAGMRIEPPPSLACAAGTIPAATAAAAPPDEPPEVRDKSHGLRVGPNMAGSVTGSSPISGVL